MNDQTPTEDFAALNPAGDTLVIQRWLPGPLPRLWAYLTDSDKRAKWLAAGEMELHPGAPLTLTWRNGDLSAADDPRPADFGEEHSMQSQITAVDPMRLLAFTWGAGEVRIELTERNDRVLLTLTHTGITDSMRLSVSAGWHTHLDILRALTEGVEPPSLWRHYTRLRGLYAAR
ncbi:SRPBCC family protein [Pararhodobacter sp.]|uniref:SRPBCC family protein n=1 Tax=Pararhodobacter sp. TaxID=2127056 RepID=UPI002FE19BE4